MPVKRDKQAKKLRQRPKQAVKKNATKQALANVIIDPNNPQAGRGGVVPPEDKRFGKAGGNPRHNGAWKKEDTLRYKLQQVAKLDKQELNDLLDDPSAGEYEKSVARILLDLSEPAISAEERWRILNGLTNQDSGMPRQQVEQTNYEMPVPLSPRTITTEPQAKPPTEVSADQQKTATNKTAKKSAKRKPKQRK